MSASTGIQIKRNDFSDPQGRIDKPDRLPATPKVHVRVFIKESNDVTPAEWLKMPEEGCTESVLFHGRAFTN